MMVEAKKIMVGDNAGKLSQRAKTLESLYRRGKVTENGLNKAVADGVITEEEFSIIKLI